MQSSNKNPDKKKQLGEKEESQKNPTGENHFSKLPNEVLFQILSETNPPKDPVHFFRATKQGQAVDKDQGFWKLMYQKRFPQVPIEEGETNFKKAFENLYVAIDNEKNKDFKKAFGDAIATTQDRKDSKLLKTALKKAPFVGKVVEAVVGKEDNYTQSVKFFAQLNKTTSTLQTLKAAHQANQNAIAHGSFEAGITTVFVNHFGKYGIDYNKNDSMETFEKKAKAFLEKYEPVENQVLKKGNSRR